MGNNPIANNKLKEIKQDTSGHNQAARLHPALSHTYYSVEQRSLEDWLYYLYEFSQHIDFIDAQSPLNKESWQAALPVPEKINSLVAALHGGLVTPDMQKLLERPDIALLLSFLRMMQYPLSQFEHFTERHKQYYYREVLGFVENDPVPDRAHLVIQLADSIVSKILRRGTRFSGGKDISGKTLVYQSLADTVLNHVRIDKLLTLSKVVDDASLASREKRLLLSRVYDREGDIELPDTGLLTFGEAQLTDKLRQSSPSVGFTCAAQELYLSGGQRTITLSFKLKSGINPPDKALTDYFDFAISSAEGMLLLSDEVSEKIIGDRIQLTIVLDEFFPHITPFINDDQQDNILLPCITLQLKATQQENMERLATLYFSELRLSVAVKGLPGIIANNELGAIDTSKPFEPFTSSPRLHSRFDFCHPELLGKKITSAQLVFDWLDLPQDISAYYKPYQVYRDRDNTAVTEGTSSSPWAKNKVILGYSHYDESADREVPLFCNTVTEQEGVENFLSFIGPDRVFQSQPLDYSELYDQSLLATEWPQWFSLTLSNNDFGHGEYAQVAQYTAFEDHKVKTDIKLTLVNPPYTPVSNNLRVNYTSSVNITLEEDRINSHYELSHIQPVGRPPIFDTHSTNITLLPKINRWGYLYIALANVVTPGQFRLYFQLDPVDGGNTSDAPVLNWSYLDTQGWTTFSRSQGGKLDRRGRIIEDSTFNLLDSGIVAFELPAMSVTNNIMGDSRFWLRVSIDDINAYNGGIAQYSRIRNVFAQGIAVELVDDSYAAQHYEQPLMADNIQALIDIDPQVDSISQPYASFSGKPLERSEVLEVRASERLRHKNRALTRWDYEHLVLAEFPELFLARCYRNTQHSCIDVVVVPFNHDASILQPKVPLFLKRRIQRYLTAVSCPGIPVKAVDPVYREVTFDVTLKTTAGFDMDSAVAEINQIFIDFLTPWNKQITATPGSLSQTIYLAEVASVLEQHPAVAVIFVLRAYMDNQEILVDLSPPSNSDILVPVSDHNISLLNKTEEIFEGIGKWKIEDDFEVS